MAAKKKIFITHKRPSDFREMPEFLSIEDMAFYYDKSPNTIKKLCQSGELPAIKLGGTWSLSKTRLKRLYGITEEEENACI